MATAMRRSRLDKLDEVDLWLPIAFDFGHFLDDEDATGDCESTESLFKRLSYLDLHYVHSTEEGQGIEFRAHHTNKTYDKYVRQLLSLAPNLRTLWVEGPADYLFLNHSAFSASLRLKSLDLDSLSIGADDFSAVVRQSADTLEKLVMRGIYLTSGTWEEILVTMSELPLLVDFFIETCGYGTETADYRPPSLHHSQYDWFLETNRDEDLDALEGVLIRLQENKRRVYGDNYEAAELEQQTTQTKGIEPKQRLLRAWLEARFSIEDSGSEASDSWTEDSELFDIEYRNG
ncbi:hypothetical protein ACHAPT_010781 [Fusarium lateritium]